MATILLAKASDIGITTSFVTVQTMTVYCRHLTNFNFQYMLRVVIVNLNISGKCLYNIANVMAPTYVRIRMLYEQQMFG